MSSPESTPQRKPDLRRLICHSNPERSRAAKLRVIRMLCAVVIEYFVCWTPFYAVQTWRSFHEHSLMENFSNLTFSLFFMLAFLSSSCNPVTYCLLNKRFRQSFIVVLRCCTLTPLRRFSSRSRSDQLNSVRITGSRLASTRVTNVDKADMDKATMIVGCEGTPLWMSCVVLISGYVFLSDPILEVVVYFILYYNMNAFSPNCLYTI